MDGQPTEAQGLHQIWKLLESMCTEMTGYGFQTIKDNLFFLSVPKVKLRGRKTDFNYNF